MQYWGNAGVQQVLAGRTLYWHLACRWTWYKAESGWLSAGVQGGPDLALGLDIVLCLDLLMALGRVFLVVVGTICGLAPRQSCEDVGWPPRQSWGMQAGPPSSLGGMWDSPPGSLGEM